MVQVAPAGLSPRVRGNRVANSRRAFSHGSIPARAGEPLLSSCEYRVSMVYPRACGGTSEKQVGRVRGAGLSPRVRGNPCSGAKGRIVCGSIPARAGEPSMGLARSNKPGVYPRACGGTSPTWITISPWSGLSPRVRGNRASVRWTLQNQRSIPARAGEPAERRAVRSWTRVYPRACGGTRRYSDGAAGLRGLSPRVRGNHRRYPGHADQGGSIPARAGEPIARPTRCRP